jgi:hypothetical protein
LEALDSETNQDKNDETAAGWLPDDDDDQCALVVRQITIKHRYKLSITPAEQEAMQQVLTSPVCDGGGIKPLYFGPSPDVRWSCGIGIANVPTLHQRRCWRQCASCLNYQAAPSSAASMG